MFELRLMNILKQGTKLKLKEYKKILVLDGVNYYVCRTLT